MRKLICYVITIWAFSMALSYAYIARLDSRPLPMELQNTSRDPEEVCINHNCESEEN